MTFLIRLTYQNNTALQGHEPKGNANMRNTDTYSLTTPFADLHAVWAPRLDDARHEVRVATGRVAAAIRWRKGSLVVEVARRALTEAQRRYTVIERVVEALDYEGEQFYRGSLDDQARAACMTDRAIEDARRLLGESDPRDHATRHGWGLLALALGYSYEDAIAVEAEMKEAYDADGGAGDAAETGEDAEEVEAVVFEAEDALDAADVAIAPSTRFDKTFELDEMPAAEPGHLPRIEQERRLRTALAALDASMTTAGLLLAVWTMEGGYIDAFGTIDHETVERLRTIAERAARRAAWACLRINSHPDLYDGDVWTTVADALAERPLLRGRAFASVAALRACPQVAHADDPRILAMALA